MSSGAFRFSASSLAIDAVPNNQTRNTRPPLWRTLLQLAFMVLCIAGPAHADDDDDHHDGASTTATASALPIARVQLLSPVAAGKAVVLDGASSVSPAGTKLTYAWRIVRAPVGSAATLDNPAKDRPRFTLDKPGDYTVELIARNASGASAPVQFVVSTVNQPPAAQATIVRHPVTGVYTLDATSSFDADGDALTYTWTIVGKPAGSAAVIADAQNPLAQLATDVAGAYAVRLSVTDSRGVTTVGAPLAITSGQAVIAASAGPDRRGQAGSVVWLDPFGSTSSGTPLLNASWALISVPAGSAATLGVEVLGRTPFTPDLTGDYVAQVKITGGTATAYNTVVISVGSAASAPPVARAGNYAQAILGTRIDLDGTASTDVDGDLVSFNWSILSKPAGSTASLSSASSPRPSIVTDVAGLYAVQLRVTDQTGVTGYSTALISTAQLPPVANAGPDQLADGNRQADLSAAASFGDITRYRWSLLGYGPKSTTRGGDDDRDHHDHRDHHGQHDGRDGRTFHQSGGDDGTACDGDDDRGDGHDRPGQAERGSHTTISPSAGVPSATIATPDAAATRVTLGSGTLALNEAILIAPVPVPYTGSDTGKNGSGLRLVAMGKLTPTSGASKTVWLIRNSSTRCKTVSLTSSGNGFSASFSLRARTELYIAVPLATSPSPYKLTEGERQRDSQVATAQPFTDTRPIAQGTATPFAVFQVSVSNPAGSSASTALVTTGNVAPVANITGPDSVFSGAPAVLDGSSSRDANGTPLTYRWSLIYRPHGSQATLASPTAPQVTITPDQRGVYIAQLIVSDGVLESAPRTFVFIVPNRAPAFTSQPLLSATQGTSYTYAAIATDPDGDTITYSLVAAPAGMQLQGATLAWTPSAAGSSPVTIRATDALGANADQSFVIAVTAGGGNGAPVMAAIGDRTILLGQTLAFTVSATDPNGDAIAYAAAPLPEGATLDATTGAFSFRPTSATPSNYVLTFSATDGKLRAQQTVTVTVTSGDPAALASLSGRVLDATEFAAGRITPISGATVQAGTAIITTSASGTFTVGGLIAGLTPLSATSTGYAAYSRTLTVFGGSATSVDPDILLTRITGTGVTVDPATTTSVSSPAIPGVAVTVPTGSAKNPDGTPYTGTLTLVDVPPAAAGLPDTIKSCSVQLLAASQPVSFSPPAPVLLPNRDALPANTKVEIWAYEPAGGTYIRVAHGQVSADGTQIATTLGGIESPTMFVATPIPAESASAKDQPKEKWVPSIIGEGNLRAIVQGPAHKSTGQSRASSLLYNSSTAAPRPVLSSTINVDVRRGLPSTLETQLYVNGVKIPDVHVTNLDQPFNLTDKPLTGNAEKVSRQITFDAGFLKTGTYDYRILTFSKYACTSIASVETGKVFVNNRSESEYGRGWKNAELQKITISPNGAAVIEEPDGSLTKFDARKATTNFDRKSFRHTPNGGNYVVSADFNGDGRPDFAFTEEGNGKISVYLNQGDGDFARRSDVTYFAPGNPAPPEGTVYAPVATSLSTGDINRDGIPDLIITAQSIAGATSGVYYALGLGNGTFGPATILPGTQNTNANYTNAEIADLDSDGTPDIIIHEGIFNAIVILWGKSDGSFERGTQSFEGNTLRLAIRDLNADGRPDLFYSSGPFLYAYLNKGDRTFQQIADVKSEYTSLTLLNQIYDVSGPNRQGQTDIVIARPDNQITVAYFDPNRGSAGGLAIRTTATIPNGTGYISAVRFADINGDGINDILLGLQNSGVATTALMYGKADGTYDPPTTPPVGHGADANLMLDVDGDGGLDLISLNRFDGYVDLSTITDGKFVSPLPDFTTFEKQPDGTYLRRYKDGTGVRFNAQGLQTAVVDPNGNTTSYEYDSAGRLLKATDPAGLATVYAYANGVLTSVTDPSGRVTQFAMDGGLLKAVQRADATTQSFAYNDAGLMTGETEPRGNTTTNTYNAAGQITQATFPDGASVKLDVAKSVGLADLSGPAPIPQNYIRPEDRVTRLTDARGKITTMEVNEWGGIIRSLDPLGRATTYTRAPSNLVTRIDAPSSVAPAPVPAVGAPATVPLTIGPGLNQATTRFLAKRLGIVIRTGITDPLAPPAVTGSLTTTVAYDDLGNATDIRKAVGTALETRTTYEYEPVHSRVVKRTEWDYAGPFTSILSMSLSEYDSFGNLTKSTEADNVFAGTGPAKLMTYDARGLKTSDTDENGVTTTYAYDANGLMTSATNANGVTTTFAYDANGNAISQTEAAGTAVQRTVTAAYDPMNRMTALTDGEGNTYRYEYDSYGNVITTTDPTGIALKRTYDLRQRVASETDPASGTSTYDYDPSGNLVRVTDPAGVVSTAEFDDANRLVRTVDGKGGVRLTTYDLRDNVTTDGDALGNTTAYVYDLLDRVTTRTDASGKAWAFTYDARDLRTKATKPSGRALEYQYDARKRLTNILSNFTYARNYQYAANSNLIALTEFNNATLTYSYDGLNRISAVDLPYDPNNGVARLTYGYDSLDRRTVVTDETGATHRYAYDRNDRVVSVTAPSGKSVGHAYDAGDRPTKYFWPNGLRSQLAYDTGAASGKTGRLTSIARGLDGAGAGGSALNQLLGTFSFGYESRGNLASIAEPLRTRSFTYDALERLTKVEEPRPAPALPVTTETYTLDAEGNRIASQLSAFHVTAPANRLIEDANAAYEYDADGNMVTKTIKATGKQWRFAYDAFDRLIAAERYASAGATGYETRVEYTHDGLNNRLTRRELDATGSALKETSYHHDLNDIDSIVEITTASNGARTKKRSWFTRNGTDNIYMVTPGAQATPFDPISAGTSSLYVSADQVGSIRVLSDDAQQIIAQYDYDSFGNMLTNVDGVQPQPYRYTARLWDSTTGLYHYRAREYDPVLGRFLQEDPIGFESGDMNIYRYVGGNPLRYRDPSGNTAIENGTLAAVATAGLIGGGIIYYGTINSGKKAAIVRDTSTSAAQGTGGGIACAFYAYVSGLFNGGPVDYANCGTAPYDTTQGDDYVYKPKVPADDQRQTDYLRAKDYCNTPPPENNNRCSFLSSAIDRTKNCIDLYKKWDDKYEKNRHDPKIATFEQRLKNLKEEAYKRCLSIGSR
ncbi:MAG: FG-GAP-like repeat-containing protein [Hyphomicrobiaceae bacterium]